MHILLIQPKMKMRPMDTNLKARMSPSLALLTLLNLTPDQHQMKICNENIEKIDFHSKVDLVAITVTVDTLNRAIEIADEFKKLGIQTVAGGIHVTADPESALKFFDAICIGKAEKNWSQILEDKENSCLQKIYKEDKNDVCKICSPRYKGIDSKKYLYTNIVSTSRGCPHTCDFCYNSCENSVAYTNRPIDDVINDIKTINRDHILFIDDNFIGNPQWTSEFLTKIIPYKMKWHAAVTVNIVKYPALLDLMKESGCQSLFIGFESINPVSLNRVGKKQNNIELYDTLITEVHRRGIMINASIVFGLPDDTADVFQGTLEWLVRNKIETATAHILTPYPGTALYKRMLEQNQIIDFDLSHYNTAHVVFKPAKMTMEQLYEGYIRFYKKFYSFHAIIKRLPEDKKQRIPYLGFNLFYRKYGKLTDTVSNIIPLQYLGRLAAKISYGLK